MSSRGLGDRSGRGVPNLKVSWTFIFRNGEVVKGSNDTNAQGRAAMTLPSITAAMSKGLVSVVARTQSASVNRTTTSSFRIY